MRDLGGHLEDDHEAVNRTSNNTTESMVDENKCGLTCRSTGAPTAGHLARAALLAYPAPHGLGVHPRSPGSL